MTLGSENRQLHRLVNINMDACEFYEDAADKVSSARLRETFRELDALHRNVMTDIQAILVRNGGDAEADETLRGQMAQFWGELKARISNDMDAVLVSELEEAEDRCLHSMQDVLADTGISETTRLRLEKDLKALERSHGYMKSLKGIMKAA